MMTPMHSIAVEPKARIGILVQGRSHLVHIVAELARLGVSFRATDIDPLGERPVVLDLLALTRALSHLADRPAWLAVLRAPWCGLTWTDLAAHLPAARRGIGRNALAALLLEELLPGLERYAVAGFAPFREDWNQRDLLTGKRIGLEGAGPFRNGMRQTGTALGVDEGGGLAVDIDGYGVQVLHAAEVSILDA